MKFHPLVRSVQKIVVYETKTRFYIVGSNEDQSKFRVLKIDRTEAKDLVISDDKIIYSEKEIRELLTMIDVGNRYVMFFFDPELIYFICLGFRCLKEQGASLVTATYNIFPLVLFTKIRISWPSLTLLGLPWPS